jgi:hypothetical protein
MEQPPRASDHRSRGHSAQRSVPSPQMRLV